MEAGFAAGRLEEIGTMTSGDREAVTTGDPRGENTLMDLSSPMHPNKIDAIFIQMRNDGQFYIPLLGGPPLSIHDWRSRELEKWSRVTGDK